MSKSERAERSTLSFGAVGGPMITESETKEKTSPISANWFAGHLILEQRLNGELRRLIITERQAKRLKHIIEKVTR